MSKLEEIVEKRAEVSKLKEDIKSLSKDHFYEGVKDLLSKHADIVQIFWTQYTPYFNDGDSCTFWSMHGDASVVLKSDMVDNDDITDIDDIDHCDEYGDYNDPIVKEVRAFLGNFEDDDMLNLFEDHALVIIDKDGVKIKAYSHE